QHEQQLFEEQPAPRRLTDLQELQGTPIDDVETATVEQEGQRGNWHRSRAEKRMESWEAGAHRGRARWPRRPSIPWLCIRRKRRAVAGLGLDGIGSTGHNASGVSSGRFVR